MWGAGGGGGYSGGGGNSRHAVGGGGGSFNSGTDQSNSPGANQGHGKVIITYLSGTTGSPLNNGLVAWYPLDGNGTDQSATANHATVYGATPTADRHGVAGKALLFEGSGSNDYLQPRSTKLYLHPRSAIRFGPNPLPPPTTMAARLPSGVMAVDSTYTRCLTTPGLTGPETVDGRNSILSL